MAIARRVRYPAHSPANSHIPPVHGRIPPGMENRSREAWYGAAIQIKKTNPANTIPVHTSVSILCARARQ